MDAERGKELEISAWQMAIEASVSGAGILTQLALGAGIATTVAGGIVPVTASALLHLTREVIRRRQKNPENVLNRAAESVGGLDILEERLFSHDERIQLLGRVLEAAARTTLEKKVRALTRVLVDGLQDDADMGEAHILAEALAAIEEAHALVLQRIHDEPVAPEETRINQNTGWERNDIAQAMPEFNTTLDGILAVLAGHGLLMDMGRVNYPGKVGPVIWTISPLGSRIVFLLSHEVELLSRQMQEED